MVVKEDDMYRVLLLGGGWVGVWFVGLLLLHIARRRPLGAKGNGGVI
jgi:hypothetical protein